jgi:myo-inositol-1(or 4)-monophosphatase
MPWSGALRGARLDDLDGLVNGSAAVDLAWVAEDRTDATAILSDESWDTAAGVLIAREAGAMVVDRSGATHGFRSTETIATMPAIAGALLGLVAAA